MTTEDFADEVGLDRDPTAAEALEQELQVLKEEVRRLHRHLEEVEANHQQRIEQLERENRLLMSWVLEDAPPHRRTRDA
jgi:hypothetical protein